MTSPEKLATPDSVMALADDAIHAYASWLIDYQNDHTEECGSFTGPNLDNLNDKKDKALRALRAEVEALATQRQGEGESLRDALQGFLDFHTKPAGVKAERIIDKDLFRQAMDDIDKREKALVEAARAAIASTTKGEKS